MFGYGMELHTLLCRVFIKPEDDAAAIKSSFLKFFPFNLDEEKVQLITEHVQGFEQTFDILRVKLDKQRHLSAFLKQFTNLLSENDKKLIVEQAESRLDEDGLFYVRLDKAAWLAGTVALTDGGDCFHFTFEIAAFPKNRKNMLKTVAKIFNKGA